MTRREESIRKTIDLWKGMQKEYGDCPEMGERMFYKLKNVDDDVCNGCHLCQYELEESNGYWDRECSHCPVQHWPGDEFGCEHMDWKEPEIDWRYSPISKILEVLEKELEIIGEEGDK